MSILMIWRTCLCGQVVAPLCVGMFVRSYLLGGLCATIEWYRTSEDRLMCEAYCRGISIKRTYLLKVCMHVHMHVRMHAYMRVCVCTYVY